MNFEDSRVDTFAHRLDLAMKNNNINQIELAEKTKKYGKSISQSLINKYLKGKAFARQKNIYILCKILNVDEAWIMGFDVPMKRTPDEIRNDDVKVDKLGNPVTEIPIVGIVKAGYDYLAQENWIGTVDIDKKLAESGEFFALKLRGDSMVPFFFENDIVIFRKQNDCENNQLAVVIVNGNEGTFKKVKKIDDGSIKLIPYNRTLNPETGEPYYEDKTFSKEEIEKLPVTIAGVFQELRRTEIKF